MAAPDIDRILADQKTGAWETERRLIRALVELQGTDADYQRAIEALSTGVLERHASKANLLRLVNRIWLVWERPLPAPERRALLASALGERQSSIGHRMAIVGNHLLETVADRSTVLTLSRNGTVAQSLRFVHEMGRAIRVVVAEGRPRCQGFATAEELRAAGIPTWLAVDAALPAILQGTRSLPLPFTLDPERTLLVLGADGITPMSFVHHVGSYAAALAAQHAGVPVLLLATEDKLLPPELFGLLAIEPADPTELGAPGNPPALNFRGETVPLDLLRHAILDTGIYTASELRDKIHSLPISTYVARHLEAQFGAV